MVDSISSSTPVPLSTQAAAAPTPARPEPAVQVTDAAAGRHGGNATAGREDSRHRSDATGTPESPFEEINAAMQAWDTGMRFEIDEDTQRLVVSVIDTQSGEVLRQIPSEEVLHVAKMITQFQGNLLNTKA